MHAYRTLCSLHTSLSVIVMGALLTSCSSPPKPPTVDDSNKRPVNSEAAIQLQACRSALTDSTLVLNEMARGGMAQPGAVRSNCGPAARPTTGKPLSSVDAPGNVVAVVPFGLASAAWPLTGADADQLVERAQAAQLVMIRGRTDATVESVAESMLARRRAEAAAGFLRTRGVPQERLRITWQGAGDALADATDRSQHRRVEIEFYGAAPTIINMGSARSGV